MWSLIPTLSILWLVIGICQPIDSAPRVVERRKQIEIEEQEVRRKEKELMSTVKLPAEAESYKVQTIAEGKRTQTVEAARSEAERVRLTGAAEARAIEAVGRAEAEIMRMKASAYKQYGDAAVMALVLEALPQIAAEVAAPLAKTDVKILLGGADRTTTEINKLISQLPPAVSALTGVDLSGVERVEVKDVRLPQTLQRAMAAEAEATRESKAKVIAAEGEQKASRALKEASEIISESPAALQLRYLQTLSDIAAEKHSTIIFPLPIDLLNNLVKPKQ